MASKQADAGGEARSGHGDGVGRSGSRCEDFFFGGGDGVGGEKRVIQPNADLASFQCLGTAAEMVSRMRPGFYVFASFSSFIPLPHQLFV